MDILGQNKGKAALVAVLLLGVSGLHFFTSVRHGVYHDFYDRLYYIPIIVSAYFFGLPGGGGAALFAAALFFLHLKLQWGMVAPEAVFGKYLEIVMYLVVGIITGGLSGIEKRHRRSAEGAYARLRDSFEQAKEAARLAVIGRVSAGVAHEIRNPLSGIQGALEAVASDFNPENPKIRFIKIMEKEIQRINRITENFLNVARPRPPEFFPTDVNLLLEAVLELNKENMSKKYISLTFRPDPQIPKSLLDPNQMKQVLLNVVLNGMDAMPEGGELSVVSRKKNGTMEIVFSDTGTGVDNEKGEMAFEPFFSSKPRGTGMGLAVSRQIVERHGGTISLENRMDGKEGARVSISLPIQKA